MPNVAGKKFPYTKEGMAEAEEAEKKMPKKKAMPKSLSNLQKKAKPKKAMMPKMELPKRKKKAGAMGGEMGMEANAGMPKMKKGGKVRGYGKARGGKACKMR